MRYRCRGCGAVQWRGFFPAETFHVRYAAFHGTAVGVCGVAAKAVLGRLGYATDGWTGALVLAVALPLVLLYYAVAVAAEAAIVSARRCAACGGRGLEPG